MNLWNDRTPREQKLLLLALALSGLLAIWQFVWLPLHGQYGSARAELGQAAQELAFVQTRALELAHKKPTAETRKFSQALVVETARSRSVALSRVQPEANARLTIWLDQVETKSLYGFLQELVREHGARIERASIRADDTGLVAAQITFQLEQ
jgi:type II secretory pathway component PulM